jgi:hypothetical protein
LKQALDSYQCLEHLRFLALLIRRTKAAHISIVDKQLLEIAQNTSKTLAVMLSFSVLGHRYLIDSLQNYVETSVLLMLNIYAVDSNTVLKR